MVPSLIGETYAKNLSKLPSFPGENDITATLNFLLPDDTVMLRLTERSYKKADVDYIAVVEEIAFFSPEFIAEYIDELRNDGLSDEDIVEKILKLNMVDDLATKVIARFAYDHFTFRDRQGHVAQGKQIKGAYVI